MAISKKSKLKISIWVVALIISHRHLEVTTKQFSAPSNSKATSLSFKEFALLLPTSARFKH